MLWLPVLWGSVLWSKSCVTLWSPDLDALGMLFVWVVWVLLLYLGHGCWLFCWWGLPSCWLTERLDPHHVVYAIVLVLAEQSKTTQKMKPKQATPSTTSEILITKDQRIIKVESKWNVGRGEWKKKNKRRTKDKKVIMGGEKGLELILTMNWRRKTGKRDKERERITKTRKRKEGTIWVFSGKSKMRYDRKIEP